MDAIEIFKQTIGERLKPIVVRYEPYKDVFLTHPYSHVIDNDFEKRFSDIIFDSIIFYAYEKDEIESEYQKSRLNNLRKASRIAYERRVPKTEKLNDGLLGELTLDSFIKLFFPNIEMVYSRVKYLERYPHKESTEKRAGHEVKGYDGILFSVDGKEKCFWLGQVKTGDWDYCLKEIKEDINKSIIKNYFGDAMVIMCDIMRAVSSVSPELIKIIDEINDILFDCADRKERVDNVIKYFKENNIKVRIPCLLMPDESDYTDMEALQSTIKSKLRSAFKGFSVENEGDLNIEILMLIFPLRDLNKVRQSFLEVRKEWL